MRRKQAFFTPEMGARLRELRRRKGLSQDEVAQRMGYVGKGRWNSTARLERGEITDPSLRLVTYYLKACGAVFSEFYDTLTRVEPVPIDPRPVLRSGLPTKRQDRIIEQTGREVQKYNERIAYPLASPPMKPERQRSAVEGLRQYRMQVNIIDEEVVQLLEKEADLAKAEHRPVPVKYYDYFKYKLLARRILSVMRKHGEAGFKHKGTKTRQGQGKQSAASNEQKSAGRLENPRKKSLVTRLVEAFDLAREMQLNEEVAEKVMAMVIRRYQELSSVAPYQR